MRYQDRIGKINDLEEDIRVEKMMLTQNKKKMSREDIIFQTNRISALNRKYIKAIDEHTILTMAGK